MVFFFLLHYAFFFCLVRPILRRYLLSRKYGTSYSFNAHFSKRVFIHFYCPCVSYFSYILNILNFIYVHVSKKKVSKANCAITHIVGQHQSSSLDDKLMGLLVSDNGGCQTRGTAGFAAGVHSSGTEFLDVPEKTNHRVYTAIDVILHLTKRGRQWGSKQRRV